MKLEATSHVLFQGKVPSLCKSGFYGASQVSEPENVSPDMFAPAEEGFKLARTHLLCQYPFLFEWGPAGA